MSIRNSSLYLLIVCFISYGNVTNCQVSIAQLLNGSLQTIIDATKKAVSTERVHLTNYVKHWLDHFNKAGVDGDILSTNYQANVDLYRSLAVTQQQYHIIGTLIQNTLAKISDDVKKQSYDMGLDINQRLSDLFRDLGDEGVNISHTNNQELYHIVNQGGAYALSLNRQSHQSGADIHVLEGLLKNLLEKISIQFTETVAKRHQQMLALFESNGRNGILNIIQTIKAFNS